MNTTLEDSIVGVGATIEKIAIVLFEPGQKVAINKSTSSLTDQVTWANK